MTVKVLYSDETYIVQTNQFDTKHFNVVLILFNIVQLMPVELNKTTLVVCGYFSFHHYRSHYFHHYCSFDHYCSHKRTLPKMNFAAKTRGQRLFYTDFAPVYQALCSTYTSQSVLDGFCSSISSTLEYLLKLERFTRVLLKCIKHFAVLTQVRAHRVSNV